MGPSQPNHQLQMYLHSTHLASIVQTPPNLKMPIKRYMEIGRVALVNSGDDYEKLVVIVDVINQNPALVEALEMVRSQMNLKRQSLISRLKLAVPLLEIGERQRKLSKKDQNSCHDENRHRKDKAWRKNTLEADQRGKVEM
ncbi:60S ribosomal protein L14-1-like [Hevea brasiliensis]|uniref:60S ribosomal protein L14-1-like n=1 Tax=Hevea brasiliensis TaxID=3981 RepID=UPI0025D96F0C|nr:60S ribosomal protein L14-1-like [Hevea brasiliensis]